MNTRELIETWPLFSDDHRAALLQAISSRGKNKGYLLASAPAQQKRDKWAAWSALVSHLAPARVSLWGLIWAADKERFTELEQATDNRLFRACLNTVEPSLRWNLWAYHHDQEAARAKLPGILEELTQREALRVARAYAVEAGQQEFTLEVNA